MSRHLNRDDVERRLDRLADDYGEYPVAWREETWSDEEFEDSLARARQGYIGGAHVLVRREPAQAASPTASMPDGAAAEAPRLLLGLGRSRDVWGPPGGGREAGETYEAAAIREVREETGIDVSITGIHEVLRWTTTGESDERVVHTAFVRFTGRYEGGQIRVQAGELNGAAWFRRLPPNLHEFAADYAAEWPGGQLGDET